MRSDYIKKLKDSREMELVHVPICLTKSEVQEVFNHINQMDEFPVEPEHQDINKPVLESK